MTDCEVRAERLVRDLLIASSEYTKAVNRSGRRGTKSYALRERRAVKALLAALGVAKPSNEQLDRICIL